MPDALYSGDDSYWEAYQRGRPQPRDNFFQRIYDYHSQHGGRFDMAHDAGAGGGVYSAQLAKRFKNVLVTDVSESNIATAKSHLKGPQYQFKVAKLEDTIDLPPASVDMVFGSTMLHFTDTTKAMEAIAHQLKPGGTLAVTMQGMPRFIDPIVHERYKAVFHAGARDLLQRLDESVRPAWVVGARGYDSVAIPGSHFVPGSLRVKLNEASERRPGEGYWYEMFVPPDLRDELPPTTSAISPNDEVIYEVDDDWAFHGDINFMKQHLDTVSFDFEKEDIWRCWEDLVEVVGDKTVEARWVTHLILATRK